MVYLNVPLRILFRRLGNLEKRGVVLKNGQTLQDLYKERVPLYKKYAALVIDIEGKNLETSLRDILDILKEEGTFLN